MKRIIALCIGFAVLTGCATNSAPRTNYNETVQRLLTYSGEPVNRFTTMRGIRNWEVVSDDHLVLYTDNNTAYLVKVWSCPELLRTHSVQVVSTLPNSVRRSDKIVVGDQTCPIREIRQVDVFRMKADKKASKEQKKT